MPWPDEPPVMMPGQTYGTVTDTIADAVLKRPIGVGWLSGLFIAGMLVMVLLVAVTYCHPRVGIWGIEIPVAWGFAIINSCGGSVSVTPARSFPQSCCC